MNFCHQLGSIATWAEKSVQPVVKAGSLLIAITGEGKARGIAAITRIDTTINQHLAYISVADAQVDPEFLLYYLTSIHQILRDESSAQGSTKGAITCGELAKVPVLLPPLEQQRTALDRIKNQLQHINQSRDVTLNGGCMKWTFPQSLALSTAKRGFW